MRNFRRMPGGTMDNDVSLEFLNEPVNEYFVTHIARTEVVDEILVRLYCCKQMGNRLQLEYTVLLPIKRMAEIGRQCFQSVIDVDQSLMCAGNLVMN